MQERLQKGENSAGFFHNGRILFAAKHIWSTLHMSRPLLFCRQLFAGHVVGSRPMKQKKNLFQMIIGFKLLNVVIHSYYHLLPMFLPFQWLRAHHVACK